jgi:hypothetical protein
MLSYVASGIQETFGLAFTFLLAFSFSSETVPFRLNQSAAMFSFD